MLSKNKKKMKMKEMGKLTNTELEQVNGGTTKECASLVTLLELNGYGTFTKVNNDRGDLVDHCTWMVFIITTSRHRTACIMIMNT